MRAEKLTQWSFINTPPEAQSLAEWLGDAEVLGLDTETFSQPSNRTAVSLVQLAKPNGEAVVIDALAVGVEGAIREIVESPTVAKVAHNARFDEGVLLAAGLQPAALIDTLQLARWAVSAPSYSLKALTAELFGVELDKSFQRSNWRRRPLTDQQLLYAATDAHITLRLYFELQRQLEERGRWELALRASTLKKRSEATTQRRRQSVKLPPVPLTPAERRIAMHLKSWRLRRAHDLRVPAYMICSDRTLDHLAQAHPATREELEGIYGLGAAKIERFGNELLSAVREAIAE